MESKMTAQLKICFYPLCAFNLQGTCQAPLYTGQKEIVCPHPAPSEEGKRKPNGLP